LSYKDLKAAKKIGAVKHDEPVLVEREIDFIGQAIFLIAAENEHAFLEAKKLIKIELLEETPVITIEDAMQKKLQLDNTRKIERGDLESGFVNSDFVIEGQTKTNAQEQWYLETQISIAIPGEGDEMKVYCSTQNPNEVQMLMADVLGINANEIEVEVRRMGGAFGGKETQSAIYAIWAALLAKHTQSPVKVRLERHIDQQITGKRHPFLTNYKVGFDKNGKIIAADIDLNANGGAFADLSMAILERSMLHAENVYYIPNIKIQGRVWLTNVPPNTAFRGFGGPQGIFNIENIIEKIARKLNKDVIEIQQINYYSQPNFDLTPYGQKVENIRINRIKDQLFESSSYFERKKDISEFNKNNKFKKRGIWVTPVKFGISFTTAFLNQAGALVHIYTDGTVLVNHGGTEMGQGLNTKMQQITASEFGISPEKIKVNATNTAKIPNASATAASTGTDINGMAVKDAIDKIKKQISLVIANEFNKIDTTKSTKPEDIVFENNFVFDKYNPKRKMAFEQAIPIVRLNKKSLSSSGFYATPGIDFDRTTGKGTPFFYFAYGMSITEVEVDLLTGKTDYLRADILHDVGDSINPEIDKGQVEGAYIQGLGWCMLEDSKWNLKGQNLTSSPDTYKIPGINDIPKIFNVQLLDKAPNETTIKKSKAVGEPPFIHGLSAWFAVKDALWAISDYKVEPNLNFPATNEYVVLAVDEIFKKI
jgi:xanthine dehydrogenase molybdopterin binding subunit